MVLVAGAFASIATSRAVEQWELNEDDALVAGTIDQNDSITYPIRIELRGPGPYSSLNGLIIATIEIDARGRPAVETRVTARLASTTHPEIPADEDTTSFVEDNVYQLSLAFDAWNGCNTTDACAENFELVFTRGASPDRAIFDITGSIEIEANGYHDLPEGTTLVLTIGAPR